MNEPEPPILTTIASEEPRDRLTRICDDMTKVFDAHPEHAATDKCMVFLDDGHTAGIVLHGYASATDATADLLLHLRAMFVSQGKHFDIVFFGEDGAVRA